MYERIGNTLQKLIEPGDPTDISGRDEREKIKLNFKREAKLTNFCTDEWFA